jgi:hypothetical protein
MRNAILILLLGCPLIGGLSQQPPGQMTNKPRLRLFPLELRTPAVDTYSVPSNIDAVRTRHGFTVENLSEEYLESCRTLGIQPFQFDTGGDLYRELFKMQLIHLGVFPYPGYREATVGFFEAVERELEGTPPFY